MIRPPRSANGEKSDYRGAGTEAPETLGDGKLAAGNRPDDRYNLDR